MPINSRQKGARGERQWRDELRANGYEARRGQQFCGGADSPDVVCPQLAFIHWEIKAVERLNIEDAMEQARRDAAGQAVPAPYGKAKVPIVAHRRNFRSWLVTMDAETFFRFLRGDFLTKCSEPPSPFKGPLGPENPPSPEASAFAEASAKTTEDKQANI